MNWTSLTIKYISMIPNHYPEVLVVPVYTCGVCKEPFTSGFHPATCMVCHLVTCDKCYSWQSRMCTRHDRAFRQLPFNLQTRGRKYRAVSGLMGFISLVGFMPLIINMIAGYPLGDFFNASAVFVVFLVAPTIPGAVFATYLALYARWRAGVIAHCLEGGGAT